MKYFSVYFIMTDHYGDDAGYKAPTERSIVDGENKQEAIETFCSSTSGELFEIVEVIECKF